METNLFPVHQLRSLQTHYHSRILGVHLRVLAQQLLSLFRNHFRQHNLRLYELIAMGIWIAQAWCATAAQTELLPGLGTWRNAQLRLALDCRDLYLCPQRRFSHSDRDGHIDVVTFAGEVLMPPDIRNDVKIARRRTQSSAFTFSGHAHAGASVDAGGNSNFDGFSFRQCALAFTKRARWPALAASPAIRTLLSESESSARALHLP